MTKITSTNTSNTTGINTNLEISTSFEIDTGTETIFIDDKLLTNYDVCEARAKATLLEQGYVTKKITVRTYHLDNININDIISVDGILYKTILLKDIISRGSLEMEIQAVRWE